MLLCVIINAVVQITAIVDVDSEVATTIIAIAITTVIVEVRDTAAAAAAVNIVVNVFAAMAERYNS